MRENESHGITETLQVAYSRERCSNTEPVVSGRDPNRIERGIDRSWGNQKNLTSQHAKKRGVPRNRKCVSKFLRKLK